MKNLNLKRISIALISFLFTFTFCSTPTKPLIPDSHPQLTIAFNSTSNYTINELKMIDAESIIIDSLYIQVAYKLNENRWIIIGNSVDDDPSGLKLLLVDPQDNYKLIYRSKGAYESLQFRPTVFVPSIPEDPTVILCAIGQMDSWGQSLFLMNGDTINEIAYLDLAMKVETDTAFYENGYQLKDISSFTTITKNENGIHFNFNCDSLMYFGSLGDRVDPIIDPSALSYRYYSNKLSLEWK